MNQLTIALSNETYRRLAQKAFASQKSTEQLVTEHLEVFFGLQLKTDQQALQEAQDFVAPWAGNLFHFNKPYLDEIQSIWRVPLAVQRRDAPPVEVGVLEIDAQTGKVITRYDEVKAIIQNFQALFGMEPFPKEKQARLSELLDKGNRGPLTAEGRQELDLLIQEAEAQATENLMRLNSSRAKP